MARLNTNVPAYRKKADLQAEWRTFRKGLNLLLRPTEITREEYSQGDNIMLIGSGVPTGRWGSTTYFTANATGTARGFLTYVNTASVTNEILAATDQGYLSKKNGTGSSVISGLSFPSGTVVRGTQLGNRTFIVSKQTPFSYYDGQTITVFATISPTTNLMATNISGVSGTNIQTWKVTAVSSSGGETNAPTYVSLGNLPQDLTRTQVLVTWSQPSAASITAFQIYRGTLGEERFVAAVGGSTTRYIDSGDIPSDTIYPPLLNTTGGIKSNFIKKFNDRLLIVDNNDRNKLIISGRYPSHYKFSWIDGGGYVYIDPDSGTDITGIEVLPGSNKIVVYKDFSHYQVTLNTVQIGNYTVLDPSYEPISTSIGASNPDTLQVVENDIFYFGRKGLYVTGYEPNFLSIIRTNEISARLRPYLANLSNADYLGAVSAYIDNKYLLSFPSKRDIIVYDRERGCFAGIWKMPFGVTSMMRYVDDGGTERWVFGTDASNQTYTFEDTLNTDNGTKISKSFRTNKEYFTTWSILKIVKLFYSLFRNVTGTVTVNINLEDRDGRTTTIKTFDMTGETATGYTGWGANLFGTTLWGDTEGTISTGGGDELTRWARLYKIGTLLQVEVITNTGDDNFELLQMRITASAQGEGSLPSSKRV